MHDTLQRHVAAPDDSPATPPHAASPSPGRRSFLRRATGTALTVLASGAATVLHARPAAATSDDRYEVETAATCCALVADHSPWCSYYCMLEGIDLYCWTCNQGACRCCECFVVTGYTTCWEAGIARDTGCSYRIGCCYDDDLTIR